MPALLTWAFTALCGDGDGPVVAIVNVTDTGAPFRFTVVGLKDAVTPGGRIFPMLNVAVLGIEERGVTVTGVVTVCPYGALIALLLETLKSGMLTVTKSPFAPDPL